MDDVETIRRASEGRLLTGDEEQVLATLVHQGNLDARNLLVERNIRLAYAVAGDYYNPRVDFEDMVSGGAVMGLITAADKFEPGRGRFSTYATYWIRQSLARYLYNTARPIRLPVHMGERIARIRRHVPKLLMDLGRMPTLAELAAACGESEAKIANALKAERVGLVRSFSEPVPGLDREEKTLGDNIADDTDYGAQALDSAHQSIIAERIGEVLGMLSDRHRRIIELRFGFTGEEPLTLAEIGQRMGLTRERVRQLEVEALRQVRALVADEPVLQEAA